MDEFLCLLSCAPLLLFALRNSPCSCSPVAPVWHMSSVSVGLVASTMDLEVAKGEMSTLEVAGERDASFSLRNAILVQFPSAVDLWTGNLLVPFESAKWIIEIALIMTTSHYINYIMSYWKGATPSKLHKFHARYSSLKTTFSQCFEEDIFQTQIWMGFNW